MKALFAPKGIIKAIHKTCGDESLISCVMVLSGRRGYPFNSGDL